MAKSEGVLERAPAVVQARPNCPFYERHGTILFGPKEFPQGPRLTLVGSGGNQCGLVMTSYAPPCEMMFTGAVPDWRASKVLGGSTVMFRGLR